MISPKNNPATPTISKWRSLCDISSPVEAVILSAHCRFSLDTTTVLCHPATAFFALVEQERPGAWRWVIYAAEDVPLAQGSAPSQWQAQQAALRDSAWVTPGGEEHLLTTDAPAPALIPNYLDAVPAVETA